MYWSLKTWMPPFGNAVQCGPELLFDGGEQVQPAKEPADAEGMTNIAGLAGVG